MRILDKNWPFHALAMLLFAGGLGFVHFMISGIDKNFGAGFAIGAAVGVTIALLAAGWRKGEMAQEAPEPEPRFSASLHSPIEIEEYSRQRERTRQDNPRSGERLYPREP
jgi:hypothetical protein